MKFTWYIVKYKENLIIDLLHLLIWPCIEQQAYESLEQLQNSFHLHKRTNNALNVISRRKKIARMHDFHINTTISALARLFTFLVVFLVAA